MKTKEFLFTIPTKNIINSNQSIHLMVKSQRSAYLRKISQDPGAYEHTQKEEAQQYLDRNRGLQERSNKKGSVTKKMKKANCTPEEIAEAMEDIDRTFPIVDTPSGLEYEFKGRFEATCIIHTPTKRHIDPPNLWPTVKPLLDGLTDSGWWEDDDSTRLVRTSFERGENSTSKGDYQITIIIKEIS